MLLFTEWHTGKAQEPSKHNATAGTWEHLREMYCHYRLKKKHTVYCKSTVTSDEL
jgi:hypothetical protein